MIVAEQLSVTVAAAYVTVAAHWPPAAFTLTLPGQVIAGAWLSTTVTVKEQVAVLPVPSVTVAVTVVAPRLNVLPEARLYERLNVPSPVAVAA